MVQLLTFTRTVCRQLAPIDPIRAFDACFGGEHAPEAERVQIRDLVAGDHVLDSEYSWTRVAMCSMMKAE